MAIDKLIAIAIRNIFKRKHYKKLICSFFVVVFISPSALLAQAVTSIITDYNGYWKSTGSNLNTIKPDNSHNLLAFTYAGVQYSTGVNDNLLSDNGETFVAGDFWSLPVSSISGTITSNTKIGLGALYDGVANGSSNPAPENSIIKYLTDGSKGLNLGTCVANLPVGTLSFSIYNIQPGSIGDGIPDIIVTQVADPTGSSYDRYEFIDANGNRIGNYKDIVFTNIAPVGNWTADFYEASTNPMTLGSGFTQTDRPLRLWAADLSDFGITAANYSQITNFRINLCGNSDVAFVAYNNKSVNFGALPVQLSSFKGVVGRNGNQLLWQSRTEMDSRFYYVERSADGKNFELIDSIAVQSGLTTINNYSYVDRHPLPGKNYYRLGLKDDRHRWSYSATILMIGAAPPVSIQLFPNPATGTVTISHPPAGTNNSISIYNSQGIKMVAQLLVPNATQTRLSLQLPANTYYLVYDSESGKITLPLVVVK